MRPRPTRRRAAEDADVEGADRTRCGGPRRRRSRPRRPPRTDARLHAARVAVDDDRSRWSCSPVLVAVGGLLNLPFSRQARASLEHWLEPVIVGEHDAARRLAVLWASGRRSPSLAAVVGIVARLRRSTSSAGSTRPRSSSPSSPTPGTSTRPTPRSWAARARPAFEGVAGFDRTVIDGAVNGVAAGTVGLGDRSCAASRPASCAATPLGIAVGAVAAARPSSSRG